MFQIMVSVRVVVLPLSEHTLLEIWYSVWLYDFAYTAVVGAAAVDAAGCR
jgi:hypothetical protein